MIFYFSGTGNSKWVAKNIAERIGDKAYDITEAKEFPPICNKKQIGGFVFLYMLGEFQNQ